MSVSISFSISLLMCKVVVVAICLACVSHGRRTQFSFANSAALDSHAYDEVDYSNIQASGAATRTLATLLRAFSPAAGSHISAFNPTGAGLHTTALDRCCPSGKLVPIMSSIDQAKLRLRPPALNRRAWLAAAAGTAATVPSAALASFEGADWPLWPALPLAPYSKRKTVMEEAVPGRVWSFEQLLGVFYVHVPIRMTVVRLDSGGLFVYAPIAPTAECLKLLQPLIDSYGPIKTIVLPSVAPEHKVLAGPFARKFPSAALYTTDRQYSFPLNLPSQWLGFPSKINVLSSSSSEGNPLGDEFEFEVLTAKASKESVYQDAALYHKPSKTLLICDAIVSTNVEPPKILLSEPEYRRALLYHARDDPLEKVEDTPEVRRKGWERIVLFANFFMPGSLVKLDNAKWLAAAPKSPMPELGWGGVLPFTWRDSTSKAFKEFSAGGKPIVVPIIQIICSRAPQATKEWIEKVSKWDFERVIPAHFDAPITMGSKEFVQTFDFLAKGKNEGRFCDEDVLFLREALEGLPPNLALFPTPLGEISGRKCGLY